MSDHFIEKTQQIIQNFHSAPENILQMLFSVQRAFNYIPKQVIETLQNTLSISKSHIIGLIEFYSFLHLEPQGDYEILLSDNITDRMLGNQDIFYYFSEKLARNNQNVTLEFTSCTGLCDQGPAALINGHTIIQLNQQRVDEIVDLINQNKAVETWPQAFFAIQDNIYRKNILLEDNVGKGQAIEVLRNKSAEDILQEMHISGLRGRGGAGFPTGKKWQFCKNTEAEQRFVVCNADEGEPGTFKDRVLLNSYAELLLDGMIVCAGVIGAQKGFIYLRAEYLYLKDKLEKVLETYRENNLLGQNIKGKQGFDFEIEIHMGAGAYICGEESALIESLEGKRGIPRNRPPFPVTHGYMNKPTVVNNVETFIAAAKIAVLGGAWFANVGTEQSRGTKIISISGDCEKPGIYEYPMGISIHQILVDCGAKNTQAVQVAGAAGVTLNKSEFNRTIAYEDIATGGSFMIFNQSRNILDMVENFAHFFAHESCGFCTPCRVGGSLLKDLVDKTQKGHATQIDLAEMKKISILMKEASHCGLGATASNHVLDTLDKFPHAYQAKLSTMDYEPSFDLEAALSEAREIAGHQ